MQGISSKALATENPVNKKKYQGYEYNTDFDINLYESFFRSHDPQIGRFWQLDPKPDDRISLYCSMGNNPVSITDFLGDTTRYYSNTNELLYTTYGVGYNHAMVVNDDKVDYVKSIAEGLKGKEISADMGVVIDYLSNSMDLGITYDVGNFIEFYNNNATSVVAEEIVGEKIPKGASITVDGKMQKQLFAEIGANLTNDGGVVRVGKNLPVSCKAHTSINNSDFTSENGKVGEIHLHPYREGVFSIKVAGVIQGTAHGGPSRADQDRKKGMNSYNNEVYGNYRNVVIDATQVYLINGSNNQTIKIPR